MHLDLIPLLVGALLIAMLLLGVDYVWTWVRPFPRLPHVQGHVLLESRRVDVSQQSGWFAHRAMVRLSDREIAVSFYQYGPNLRARHPLDYTIPLDRIQGFSYKEGATYLATENRQWTFHESPWLYEMLLRLKTTA